MKYTRKIVDSIHDGSLAKAEFEHFETFNLQVPKALDGVPSELLNPAEAWPDKSAFKEEVKKLAGLFEKNFSKYADDVDEKVKAAGPRA